MAKGFKKRTANFHPGGEKGKLHRELGISEDEKIPAARLESATHSDNPEVRRDAIRAKTMRGWHHGGSGKKSDPEARIEGAGDAHRGRMPYTHARKAR